MSSEIRLAFAHPSERAEATAPQGPLDRISLRDHIVEVEIGAFQAERGTTQRVCFNVVVEVQPLTGPIDDDVGFGGESLLPEDEDLVVEERLPDLRDGLVAEVTREVDARHFRTDRGGQPLDREAHARSPRARSRGRPHRSPWLTCSTARRLGLPRGSSL